MKSNPEIVVLDGHALNPGDLSWAEFETLGNVTVYPRTAEDEIVARARRSDVLLTNKTPLSAETLAQLPALRYVGVLATGFNVVDVAAARRRGIPVSNIPAYGTDSVAQHVFALLLELTQRVGHHTHTVREGRWSKNLDWCYWDGSLTELSGLTLGVIGAGRIGQRVSRIAEAFGMRVTSTGRTAGRSGLESMLRESDVVTLHCPLTPETRHLIDATTLAWMKPTAFLVNTSRGPLVDESALADALRAGRLAGAALDVLAVEPPSAKCPLIAEPKCIITPHIAWATTAARRRLMHVAAQNVREFLAGAPRNVVN